MRFFALSFFVFLVTLSYTTANQSVAVPRAIQSLRAPLTAIPLRSLFENMNNPRTVQFYVDCVTGQVGCDRVGNALKHLVSDVRPGRDICYGCSLRERERVDYAMSVLLTDHKELACKVQTHYKIPVFPGNPCV